MGLALFAAHDSLSRHLLQGHPTMPPGPRERVSVFRLRRAPPGLAEGEPCGNAAPVLRKPVAHVKNMKAESIRRRKPCDRGHSEQISQSVSQSVRPSVSPSVQQSINQCEQSLSEHEHLNRAHSSEQAWPALSAWPDLSQSCQLLVVVAVVVVE
jgi:hypothetical protein